MKKSLTAMFLQAEAEEARKLRKQFDKELDKLDEEFKPWTDIIAESERLTERDLATRINAVLQAEAEEAAKLNTISSSTPAPAQARGPHGMDATVLEGTSRKPVDVNAEARSQRSNSGEKIGSNTLEGVWIVRPGEPIPEEFLDVLRTWKAVREHPAWKGHPQL